MQRPLQRASSSSRPPCSFRSYRSVSRPLALPMRQQTVLSFSDIVCPLYPAPNEGHSPIGLGPSGDGAVRSHLSLRPLTFCPGASPDEVVPALATDAESSQLSACASTNTRATISHYD